MIYINGIFTNKEIAEKDLRVLEKNYKVVYPSSKVTFINGYNPSHVGGIGDITQAAAQTLGSSVSGFDLTTILLQIHPQITTRKLLLVGHSQGSFYTNEIYKYLLAHGEPKAAVGVYHVGTAASSVAGGGKYLTSSNDTIINAARRIASSAQDGLMPLAAVGTVPKAKAPLPANITLGSADYGHGFSGVYLAEAPERVVGDIQGTLKNLKAEWASDTGECFTAPSAGLGYKAAKAGFAVADTAAAGVRAGAGAVQVAAVAAGNVLAAAVQGTYGAAAKLVKDIGITAGGVAGLSKAATPESRPTNFDIFSKLYGSSLSKDEYKDLLGSAVATAPVVAAPPAPQAAPQEPQPQASVEAPQVQAPKKVTYIGRSHRSNKDDEEAPAQVQEQEPVVEEVVVPVETEPAPSASVVLDTVPPRIDVYGDLAGETTSGAGLVLSYELPAAVDDVDGTVAVSCTPAPGSLFAVGTTRVECVAQDAAGNTATSTFAAVIQRVLNPAPSGSPVEDTFDDYNAKEWQTVATQYGTLILFDKEPDAANCKSAADALLASEAWAGLAVDRGARLCSCLAAGPTRAP